jgi:Na+-driven multidrug efflux pump
LAAQVLLLDVFFRSCSPQASHFLVALGKQLKLLPITAGAIILNIAFNYLFIKNGMGIAGAALGVTISSIFLTIATLIYAMRHFSNWGEIAKFILRILFPIIYIGAIAFGLVRFISIKNPYLGTGFNLLVLMAGSLPLFYHIDRKTHIIRILFKSMAAKKK